MIIATITSKGQVTIPKEIRDALTLKSGDKLEFEVNDHGDLLVKTVKRTVSDVFGRLRQSRPSAVTIDEMNRAIEKRLSKGIKNALASKR